MQNANIDNVENAETNEGDKTNYATKEDMAALMAILEKRHSFSMLTTVIGIAFIIAALDTPRSGYFLILYLIDVFLSLYIWNTKGIKRIK
jgi:hypothetical protein